jgi:excisionase family DNA binding protein
MASHFVVNSEPETLRNVRAGSMAQRFIQLSDVSETLDISSAQAYALVRSGELNAIKVGGRGQWRVEASELESYIQRMYSETKTFVAAHPFGQSGD